MRRPSAPPDEIRTPTGGADGFFTNHKKAIPARLSTALRTNASRYPPYAS